MICLDQRNAFRMSDTQHNRPTHDPTIRQTVEEGWGSQSHVYELLRLGIITAYKVGRTTKIHRESLEALRSKHAVFGPPRDAA